MTPPESTNSVPYMATTAQEEFDRLRLQSQLIAAATQTVLSQVGLEEGMHALDAGCGAGDAMEEMAARVTKTGSVTGIEINGGLAQILSRHFASTGMENCRVINGSFLDLDMPESGPFDLTFSRLVFIHLGAQQEAACRRLWQWTKPGGCLAIMEHDYRVLDAEPQLEVVSIFREAMLRLLDHGGLDRHCGARLPRHFIRAGVGEPDAVKVTSELRPVAQVAAPLRASYRALFDIASRLQLRAIASMQRFDEALQEALALPEAHVFLPLLVSAWRRKSR